MTVAGTANDLPPVPQALQNRLPCGGAALPLSQTGVDALDVVEDADVLLLERLEVVRKLLVPGVQDEDLEAERGGGDEEVCEGDGARDEDHVGGCCRVLPVVSGFTAASAVSRCFASVYRGFFRTFEILSQAGSVSGRIAGCLGPNDSRGVIAAWLTVCWVVNWSGIGYDGPSLPWLGLSKREANERRLCRCWKGKERS